MVSDNLQHDALGHYIAVGVSDDYPVSTFQALFGGCSANF